MKFTNLGSNVILLLLLSALAWGGIFALLVVYLIGTPSFVGWLIVSLFLTGMVVCISLMGLEIFRPSNAEKQDSTKQQPLKGPPKISELQLDDFPPVASQTPSPASPAVHLLPPLQVPLPALAPLQQHALRSVLTLQMQPPSAQPPPITQSLRPQESAVSGSLPGGR
ncbi:hypothetical protein GCM10023212_28030 [Luteolibacter yonseiensis]|uniref:hypothetical protein n=1 Tax=Luteolibacter yonseiensis TaxID=1144680 RepID=UPI0031ED8EFE